MNPVLPPLVHVIDDDRSFRLSLGRLLEAAGFRFRGYESGADFLAGLPIEEAGCIVLDLQMPALDGLELQALLSEAAPLLPVIFLTGQGDIERSVRAMKGGAEDFLEKTAPSATLLSVIGRAIARSRSRLAERAQTGELMALVAALTPRERTVFDLVVRGQRNKQIAHALGTSERTVKAHRKSIMEKLAVGSLAEAVSLAERLKRVDRPDGAGRFPKGQ